eukprot:NODE_1067_length_1535_cov_0.206825.p2 type:complete len:120 gc:universal NODE_1067_length_1535_cov_0.206825:804-1163(+)
MVFLTLEMPIPLVCTILTLNCFSTFCIAKSLVIHSTITGFVFTLLRDNSSSVKCFLSSSDSLSTSVRLDFLPLVSVNSNARAHKVQSCWLRTLQSPLFIASSFTLSRYIFFGTCNSKSK